MTKLIDSVTKQHQSQETHLKKLLKGLLALLLSLIIITASLYVCHADSINSSGYNTDGIYYSRCFITLIAITFATFFLICLEWWKWKHRMHHQ